MHLPDPRHHDSTNASLLVRVRDPANVDAWREFENRYSQLIRNYCLRRHIDTVDIDDISQLVWSKLAKGMRDFSYDPAKGKFRGYLYTVVRSAVSRQFANRREDATWLAEHREVANLVAEDAGHDDIWEREWTDHHFRQAFATIEQTFDPQSVAIFQRLLSGDTADQIAADFGMTPAAVNQAKHRIRSRMKDLIALQILEEDDPERFAEAVS